MPKQEKIQLSDEQIRKIKKAKQDKIISNETVNK